jgi:hypothetical protein
VRAINMRNKLKKTLLALFLSLVSSIVPLSFANAAYTTQAPANQYTPYNTSTGWYIKSLSHQIYMNTTYHVNFMDGTSDGWTLLSRDSNGNYQFSIKGQLITLYYSGVNRFTYYYTSPDGNIQYANWGTADGSLAIFDTYKEWGKAPVSLYSGSASYPIYSLTIARHTWDNMSLTLTPEKWVTINLSRNEANPIPIDYKVYVKNMSTGATFILPTGTTTTTSFVDQSVTAGNTYNYQVYDNTGTYISQNILVPSDAYEAKVAAQAAQAAAQQASQNASNASAAANSIINNYLSTANGIVQDSSGTVLTAARVASTNAQNAYNAAQNAVTGINNAQNALSSKIDSSTSTIGSKIDSSASSLQTNLGNKIDSSLSNLQTNLNNSITNIQSVMPPILTKVSGYNGATATKTGSINLTLDYSNATDYQIKVDNGAWGAWSTLSSLDTNGYITASGLSTTGVHTIYVQIRNGSNNPALAKGKFTCFEL